MATLPKLAAIHNPAELTEWLGRVIQEKLGKENAGFVEITSTTPNRENHNYSLILRRPGASYRHTITIKTERA